MNDTDRARLLAARRERLVLQARQERRQFARTMLPLDASCVWVERGLWLWRTVYRRPWLVAVPLAVVAFWRPRAVLRCAMGALTLWRAGGPVRQLANVLRAL